MKKSFATLLTPEDFRKQPWKNGKGVSWEIAAEPAGSADLLWRLSLATITESAEFSLYPGMDRFLTVVEGTQVSLKIEMTEISLRQGDVHHFGGEKAVTAALPAGPVKDLGLIYRRDKVRAEMQVLDFQAKARSFRMDAPVNFFFVVSGAFAASCYPGEERYDLQAGQVLRVSAPRGESEKVVLVEPTEKSGKIAAIEIFL